MEKQREVLSITPDASLFGKLGARSKAFPWVVTELVDNSLDSWLLLPDGLKEDKTLEVRITAGSTPGSNFIVSDNAGGMTREQLQRAMTVAHSEKERLQAKTGKILLGSYGFGLKSAAMYIGDFFRIYTKSFTEKNKVHYVEFDRVKFESVGIWELEFRTLNDDEAEKLEVHFKDGHGTVIQIRNQRYRSANQYAIVDRLRTTFAPRLPVPPKLTIAGARSKKYKYEEMHIFFITDASKAATAAPLEAAGPFYTVWENSVEDVEKEFRRLKREYDKTKSKEAENNLASTDFLRGANKDEAVIPEKISWFKELPGVSLIEEFTVENKRVWGRIGLLDKGMAHNGHYGFDLIKNGRVIETNVKDNEFREKFVGLLGHNHNARIVGQLFLDDWKSDHQKTQFIRDEPGWAEDEEKKKKNNEEVDKETIAAHVAEYVKKYHTASYALQSPRKNIEGAGEPKDEQEALVTQKLDEDLPALSKDVQRSAKSDRVKKHLEDFDKSAEKASTKATKEEPTKPKVSTTKLISTKTDISYAKLGVTAPIVKSKLEEHKGYQLLNLTLNIEHPFLKGMGSEQLRAVASVLSVDALATYFAESKRLVGKEHGDFLKLREDLLRGLKG